MIAVMTSSYRPLERRPLRSRDTRWAHAFAGFLAARGASPNGISVFGMIAAIGAGAAYFATGPVGGWGERGLWLVGGALCQVRLLCNLFDGMVAIARGVASPKGELYNEVPDRVSDAAIFIGLGYASLSDPVLGFAAALVAVFTAYVRAMAKAAGAPNDYCGPMAKPQRMALVTALSVWLAVRPDAWTLPWGETRIVLALIIALGLVTALRRLIRAARRLEANDR
jgi:phosphatidylglycerophosphate synthase